MLSAMERQELLDIFDCLVRNLPPRPRVEVDAELAELSEARRRGGRLHPSD